MSHGSAFHGTLPKAVQPGRMRRVLAVSVLGAFVLYATLHYLTPFPAPDFFALWTYARLELQHSAAELYDPVRLHALQVALGLAPADWKPFPYPPTFLLLSWPMGLLSAGSAYFAWVGLTLAGFVWAAAGPRFRPAHVLLLLAAPATTVSVVAGQSGFLSGALLVGGMRLVGQRPWLGGMLLGLLTYKPQLGLLVPVALVAAGCWRGLLAAGLTALATAVAATAVFGVEAWGDWLAALPGYSAGFAARADLLRLQPTVLANLLLMGVPDGTAHALQWAASAGAAALAWLAFRRGVTPAAIAVLIGAGFLANPHAFFYDMPMVTAAVLLLGAAPALGEAAFLLLVLCIPAAMVWTGASISLPVLVAFPVYALWRSAAISGRVVQPAAGLSRRPPRHPTPSRAATGRAGEAGGGMG